MYKNEEEIIVPTKLYEFMNLITSQYMYNELVVPVGRKLPP